MVTSEFFEQGDRERAELKLTPTVSTNLKTSLLNKQMFYSVLTPKKRHAILRYVSRDCQADREDFMMCSKFP